VRLTAAPRQRYTVHGTDRCSTDRLVLYPTFLGFEVRHAVAHSVDGACKFTKEMLPALQRAVDHLDMADDLAEVLSTPAVEVEYRVECGVTVRDE
jgi:hypothetical protein